MTVPPRSRRWRDGLTDTRAAGSSAPSSCATFGRWAARTLPTNDGAAASAAPILKSPRREIVFMLILVRGQDRNVTQRGVAATKHAALCSPVFSGDTNALAILAQENKVQRVSVTKPSAGVLDTHIHTPEECSVCRFACLRVARGKPGGSPGSAPSETAAAFSLRSLDADLPGSCRNDATVPTVNGLRPKECGDSFEERSPARLWQPN